MIPQKSLFYVVENGDMDNSIPVTAIEDFPDELGEYRESIFAQMDGEDYYASQLVLKRGNDLKKYDFYSQSAWLAEVKRQAVVHHEEQEGRVDGRGTRGAQVSYIYHMVDRETALPIYVGRSMNVERRMQQHLNSVRSLSGIPKLYGHLGQLIEEGRRLPIVRVVGKTSRASAEREEQLEISRLIRAGVPLFNKEWVRMTTRTRTLMDIEFPIEWHEGSG